MIDSDVYNHMHSIRDLRLSAVAAGDASYNFEVTTWVTVRVRVRVRVRVTLTV